MLIDYKCRNCGIIFEDHDWRHRKYCSKKCKGLFDKTGQYQKGHHHDEATEKRRLEGLRNNPPRSMLGKKHTLETRKQMSESSKFPYNYIDGGYKNKIDESKCELCGAEDKNILVHHKDGNRKNNNIDNLKALCNSCHSKTHFPDGKIGKNYGGDKN